MESICLWLLLKVGINKMDLLRFIVACFLYFIAFSLMKGDFLIEIAIFILIIIGTKIQEGSD